jgi:hypothetical protein
MMKKQTSLSCKTLRKSFVSTVYVVKVLKSHHKLSHISSHSFSTDSFPLFLRVVSYPFITGFMRFHKGHSNITVGVNLILRFHEERQFYQEKDI